MGEQQSTSRRPVLIAGLVFVVAAAAFGAAFFFLDGTAFVTDVMNGKNPFKDAAAERPAGRNTTSGLTLPQGMPEEFALRLWQEQVESQYMIGRLVDGDVETLRISRVESSSAEASMSVTVKMTDGTSTSGVIGLRRFGDEWYLAFASARSDGRIERPSSPLPSLDEVDVALLQAILAEQDDSQSVLSEYIAGTVRSINIDEVKPGPNTATINVTMNEDHGQGLAQIIAIQSQYMGKPHWFLAKFTKTGDIPAQ